MPLGTHALFLLCIFKDVIMLTHTGKKSSVSKTTKTARSVFAVMTLGLLFSSAVSAKEAPTYAMVQINQQALFFNQMNKGAADEAKKTGAKLVVYNANNNPVSQNDAIENYGRRD
jgi:ribose transport system substrate-binding protein